jgi:hypothetical protein
MRDEGLAADYGRPLAGIPISLEYAWNYRSQPSGFGSLAEPNPPAKRRVGATERHRDFDEKRPHRVPCRQPIWCLCGVDLATIQSPERRKLLPEAQVQRTIHKGSETRLSLTRGYASFS